MNFLEALKSRKRFRPMPISEFNPGMSLFFIKDRWIIPSKVHEYKFTLEGLLGEWEVEELPCEHEPKADTIRIIPRVDSNGKIVDDYIPVFDNRFHCKHCGEALEPTGWREKCVSTVGNNNGG